VDLNGNFKYKWGVMDEVTPPRRRAGPADMQEPETRAIYDLLDSLDFYISCPLHIRGEVLIWLDPDTLDRYAETIRRRALCPSFRLCASAPRVRVRQGRLLGQLGAAGYGSSA
jgi:hypothetical protein